MTACKLSKEQRAELEQLRSNGYGYKKLAKIFGTTRDYMKDYCQTHGLANPIYDGGKPQMDTVNESSCGVLALSQYKKEGKMYLRLMCEKCGTEWERQAPGIVTAVRNGQKPKCPYCDCVSVQKNIAKDKYKEEREKQQKILNEKVLDLWYNTTMTFGEMAKACACSPSTVSKLVKDTEYRYIKKCKICGKEFKTKKTNQVCCSKECKYRLDHGYEDWRLRRKIEKERTVESPLGKITVLKLVQRDNNICYLCGKKCDAFDIQYRNGKAFAGSKYPSIEHVVPLCRGGMHSWDNVKLAHRGCNTRKAMMEVDDYVTV